MPRRGICHEQTFKWSGVGVMISLSDQQPEYQLKVPIVEIPWQLAVLGGDPPWSLNATLPSHCPQ